MKKVFWTMKNGEKIDVDNMSVGHLRNTLKMIIRNVEAIKAQEKKERQEIYLHGEMAQQINEQIILEEFDNFDEWEYFNGGL